MSVKNYPEFEIESFDELKECRASCNSIIEDYAFQSAMSSIIPNTVANVAADTYILVNMYSEIKAHYNLSNIRDFRFTAHKAIIELLAKKIIKSATEDGIMKLLIKYAPQYVGKDLAAYIPIVGTGVAVLAGYALAIFLGEQFSEDCYLVGKEILSAQGKL